MNFSIAVASAFALSFSVSAFSAKPPTNPVEKIDDLSAEKEIVNDGYFATAQCDKYLDGLTTSEQDSLITISKAFQEEDAIYYISGQGSWTEDFEKAIVGTKYSLNPALTSAKKKFSGKGVISGYSDDIYSEQIIEKAVLARKAIEKNYAKGSEQQKSVKRFISCRVALAAVGMGLYANSFQGYLAYAASRVSKAQIGYFEISADSAYYGPSVNTGNQYAEPKKWEGSRFLLSGPLSKT